MHIWPNLAIFDIFGRIYYNIQPTYYNIQHACHIVISSPHIIISSKHIKISSPNIIISSPHNIIYSLHIITSNPYIIISSKYIIFVQPTYQSIFTCRRVSQKYLPHQQLNEGQVSYFAQSMANEILCYQEVNSYLSASSHTYSVLINFEYICQNGTICNYLVNILKGQESPFHIGLILFEVFVMIKHCQRHYGPTR